MIGPDERLGRRISGSKTRKKVIRVVEQERTTLPPSFFKPDEHGDVSMDRLKDENALQFLTSLAEELSRLFQGWAVLSATRLQEKEFELVASGDEFNPYHAHVALAEWQDYGRAQTYAAELTRCIVDYQPPVQD